MGEGSGGRSPGSLGCGRHTVSQQPGRHGDGIPWPKSRDIDLCRVGANFGIHPSSEQAGVLTGERKFALSLIGGCTDLKIEFAKLTAQSRFSSVTPFRNLYSKSAKNKTTLMFL